MRTAYVVVMFVVTGLCLINERVIQKYPEKKQQWTLLLFYALAITVLFTGLREYTDYIKNFDEYNYRTQFVRFGEAPFSSLILQDEPLFKIITHLLFRLTGSAQLYLFFYAALTCFLFFSVFKRHSANIPLSVFLFFATSFLFRSMNIMRQCFAMAIVAYALKYAVSKRFIPFTLHVAIACLIHSSALIMLPAYWLANSSLFSLRIKIVSVAFVVTFLIYTRLIRGIIALFGIIFPKYLSTPHMAQLLEGGEGMNIIRIFVALVPLILLFYLRHDIERKPINNFIINMSIIGFFMSLLSLRYNYFQRFVYYFSMYNLLAIPELLAVMKNKIYKLGKIIELSAYALYSCFIFIQLPADMPFSNYIINRLNN